MTLQVSLFGVLLSVIFYVLVFLILWPSFRSLGRQRFARHLRWPLAAFIVVLPFFDELWIATSFSRVCTEAGVKVFKTVEVPGFLDETNKSSSKGLRNHTIGSPAAIKEFEKNGYQFRESSLVDGRVWHLERGPSGLEVTIRNRADSLYRFSRPIEDASAGYQISCSEDIVASLATDEVLATYRYCKRYPGFLESLWMKFFHQGPVAYCPAMLDGADVVLYRQVLFPSRSRRG